MSWFSLRQFKYVCPGKVGREGWRGTIVTTHRDSISYRDQTVTHHTEQKLFAAKRFIVEFKPNFNGSFKNNIK
jgi:hypothetical protein